jgi:hypothetical protein
MGKDAEREAKAAKKAAKKAKKAAASELGATVRDKIEDAATIGPGATITPHQVINAADRVIGTKGSAPESIKKAREAKARAEAELAGVPAPTDDDTDAEIKARVTAKRTRRDLIEASGPALEALDRNDEAAVAAYNETYGKATGTYATSIAEVDKQVREIRDSYEANLADIDAKVSDVQLTPEGHEVTIETHPLTEAEESETLEDLTDRIRREASVSEQQAEEVETEKGRVFQVGTASDEPAPFAAPSDAKPEVELNGLGQYKVVGPDKKIKGYTRVTTYIKLIEDKTNLEKWSKRKLLEGVVLDQTPDETGAIVDRLGSIRDLMHNRDVAVSKARKADRKGKLAVGELRQLVDAAEKVFKDGVNGLIVELEELGGSKEAANKGTELHALAELYDREGIDAVADLLTEGKITPADLADIEAYARAVEAAGIKFLEYEKFVVDDERKVAGRLDRIGLVKFPGAKRAVRCVLDLKTGSIDYGISLSLQLENYAGMQGYDPENPEAREDLKLNRTKGVVIHLPQGTGECHIYPVDLVTGRLGNRITAEGRAFRNTGKRAIDKTVDMADADAVAAYNAKLEATS